jgi:hypothetical protein
MSVPRCPAAYLRIPSPSSQLAMVTAARQRGWPEPDLYADVPGSDAPGLAELTTAIAAARHDALLLPMTLAEQPPMLRLLAICTKQGVTVSFFAAAVTADSPPRPGPFPAAGPQPAPQEPWSTLTRARLDALSELFPAWRVWLDRHGWHARRRDAHLQVFRPGSPAFHVRADTATELAAQLCWQQAAEAYTPQGCARGRLAEEAGLSAAAPGRQ